MASPGDPTTGPTHPRGQGGGRNNREERQGERRRSEGGIRGVKPQNPPNRIRKQRQEIHEATGSGTEMEAKEEEEEEEEEDKDEDREGDIPRGAPVEVIPVGGDLPPPEENADLPDFTPERTHMLLQEVYGDFPHHNNGSHLDGGVVSMIVRSC